MSKLKILSLITLINLIAPCCTLSVAALTKSQRKFYGQNNILFSIPCSSSDVTGEVSKIDESRVTVYGASLDDKFYYGLQSFLKDQEKTTQYLAFLHYGSRFDNAHSIDNWLSVFNITIESAYKAYAESAAHGDAKLLEDFSDTEVNKFIAYFLSQSKRVIDEGAITLPIGDPDYDAAVSKLNSFIPNPGTITSKMSFPDTTTATNFSSDPCLSAILGQTSVSGVIVTPPENYTPTGDNTHYTTSGSFTVVDSPISVSAYSRGARSRGIYQGARNWSHSEVRDGKYGWNDQCYQIALALANGLRRGTYPSTNVARNPNQGSGWVTLRDLSLGEFLYVIYDQITSGHPVVIRTTLHRNSVSANYSPNTNKKDTRHFVAVVGFRSNITSPSELTVKDLYYMDAWGATLTDSGTPNARMILPGENVAYQTDAGYMLLYQKK